MEKGEAMKHLVILGHGAGGTMVAAKIRQELEENRQRHSVE